MLEFEKIIKLIAKHLSPKRMLDFFKEMEIKIEKGIFEDFFF